MPCHSTTKSRYKYLGRKRIAQLEMVILRLGSSLILLDDKLVIDSLILMETLSFTSTGGTQYLRLYGMNQLCFP